MYTFIANIPHHIDVALVKYPSFSKNQEKDKGFAQNHLIESQCLYLKGPFGSKYVDTSIFGEQMIGFRLEEKKDKSLDLLFKQKDSKHLVPDKKFTWIRSIFQNYIEGITVGFTLSLQIVGVGYKVQLFESEGAQYLDLKLGQTHSIQHKVENVRVFVPDPTTIHLLGVDKQQIGQEAAKIQAYKLPDPYKGKGVRLSGQVIHLKEPKKK